MLRKKNITLNGKKAAGNEKLAKGDCVKLFLSDETIQKFSEVFSEYTEEELDILYEDPDVILINKPVGNAFPESIFCRPVSGGASDFLSGALRCIDRRRS